MSIQVIFDRILCRLREKDYDPGSGAPSVPDPTSHLTYEMTPGGNQSYLADAVPCPGMTVTVRLKFDGDLVDADSTPSGWAHPSLGTYTKTLDEPGTVNPQQWSYTPGGQYEDRVASVTTPSRGLTMVYPAYWGIWPYSDTEPSDITGVVAGLNSQHRVTSNVANQVVNVPNTTEKNTWLWIVTKGTATALNNEFNTSIMRDPVAGKSFTSPVNAELSLQGYKVYVSKNLAEAGYGFGNVKLTINLAHTP